MWFVCHVNSFLCHVLQCPPEPLPDELLKNAIIAQCEENNLEGTPHFLSKVQQLYDMMDLSDGVMLLGDSYGGKTTATKTLAASLQKVAEGQRAAAEGGGPAAAAKRALTCVILNPKAMKIDQLYGCFLKDEWQDGILATNFRQFSGNINSFYNNQMT